MSKPKTRNYLPSVARICGTCKFRWSEGMNALCGHDNRGLPNGAFGNVTIFDTCDEHKFTDEE